jgi:hypothetical protein
MPGGEHSRHFDRLPVTSGLPREVDIITAGRRALTKIQASFRKAFHIIGNDDLRRVSFADSLQVF